MVWTGSAARRPGRAGLLILLLGFGLLGSVAGGPARAADFHTRFRANDAPIAGRFTVYAYFLDTLDVALQLPPGSGRPLLLVFADSNGDNSFLIPADFALEDAAGHRLTRGFNPVGSGRLGGLLAKDTTRMALWWVPRGREDFDWADPTELTLWYGFAHKSFFPMEENDAAKARRLLSRIEATSVILDPEAPVDKVDWAPNPQAFDKLPEVWTFREPEYPQSARRYDFTGLVGVVAQLNDEGYVENVFLLQSSGVHELNVSALVAVSEWRFRAGRKNDKKVGGDILVPIRFSEAKNQ